MPTKQEVKNEPVPESVTPREAPILKKTAIQMQSTGHFFRELVVYCPPDLTMADLNENSDRIWKAIQGSAGHALQEYDKLELRWEDKVCYARVNYADLTTVHLFDIRKVDKPKRAAELWDNGTYRVQWTHDGYCWARNSDGVIMSNERFVNPDQAKAA